MHNKTMDRTIQFILGSHNHIPYGAGDEAFEAVYNTTLKPFISTLYKYPKIQVTLHYSGVLLHWLERAHPEFFMLIGDLISRKQVALLGGGFYEPLMPLLPLSDKIGQIELLTTYLRRQFGKRPQGCMLPVMAWEQNIVWPLSTCGMEYTFLDEGYFRRAGLSDCLIPPCITEDQGKLITVFPVLSELGAAFARERASLVLENLLEDISLASADAHNEEVIICVFPEQIFTENSASESPEFTFHRFFEDLSSFESSIEFTNPDRVFKNIQKLKKVYFPCSSASGEVLEDAVPSGSFPRQFLVRYPEANGIYAKMLFTHVLINQLRGDKSRKRSAQQELWKAQGYDSFYPTKYGGITHHGIRNAAYQALLEAENITREKGVFIPSLMNFDFDLDGEEEYLFQDNQLNCYITLKGASVFELDYLPAAWNYLNTFGTGSRRTAFSDILVWPELTFQDVLEGHLSGSPIGRRHCGGEGFELVTINKEHATVYFRLPPKADVPYGDVELEKSYHLKEDTLIVTYRIRNQGSHIETFRFIPSIDLSFPGEGESFLGILEHKGGETEALVPGAAAIKDTAILTLRDIKNEVLIELTSGQHFDVWILPIRTPCLLTDMYQSTWIMPVRSLSLEPGECFETEFRLRIKKE
jgi:hypothetical protein